MAYMAVMLVSRLKATRQILVSSYNKKKYTWAPQTVHNTPVVNILKGFFLYYTFLKETNMTF